MSTSTCFLRMLNHVFPAMSMLLSQLMNRRKKGLGKQDRQLLGIGHRRPHKLIAAVVGVPGDGVSLVLGAGKATLGLAKVITPLFSICSCNWMALLFLGTTKGLPSILLVMNCKALKSVPL